MSAIIGSTPEDWTEAQLADICELTPGAATSDDPQGSVPIVKPRNLIDERISGTTDHAGADEADRRARYQIRGGDLLCARTGTIGKFALATDEQAGWIFGTGLICVRPSEQVHSLYLSLYFVHPRVQEWFSHNAIGTAVRSINARTLGSLPVSLPPLSVQRDIGRILNTLNEKIAAHKQICQATAELRDALLPMLYSGQVTVSPDLLGGNHRL